jgi:hypothetical protein
VATSADLIWGKNIQLKEKKRKKAKENDEYI